MFYNKETSYCTHYDEFSWYAFSDLSDSLVNERVGLLIVFDVTLLLFV